MLAATSCCQRGAQQRQVQGAAAGRRRQLRRAAAPRAAGGGGSGGGGGAAEEELPPELQGLCISKDGQHLIDSKTGKVVNEFGATRFDVAVRAMRGEFDPPAFMDNTERTSGLLLDSLTQFPATYEFQLVVKRQPGDPAQPPTELLQRYRNVISDVTADDIPLERCTAKERLGGKFVSLCIPARVQAAHVIDLVWAALAPDPALVMKY